MLNAATRDFDGFTPAQSYAMYQPHSLKVYQMTGRGLLGGTQKFRKVRGGEYDLVRIRAHLD